MNKEDRKFAPPSGLRRPDLSDIDFVSLAGEISSEIKDNEVVKLKLALKEIADIPAVPYSGSSLVYSMRTIHEMVMIAKEALDETSE